jgi:diguanylate cyclase (GGDEF)-like protein
MNLGARYGGDEFVSVLAETEDAGGRLHAERIAKRVAADPVLSSNGMNVSFGLASFAPGEMTSTEDLVRAADEDLYRRKAQRSSRRTPAAAREE